MLIHQESSVSIWTSTAKNVKYMEQFISFGLASFKILILD